MKKITDNQYAQLNTIANKLLDITDFGMGLREANELTRILKDIKEQQ